MFRPPKSILKRGVDVIFRRRGPKLMPDYPLQSLKAAMTDKLIPPSPSADEYAEAHMAHEAEIEAGEPFVLFAEWLKDAKAKEPNDPNAMAVATVDADGLPDVR